MLAWKLYSNPWWQVTAWQLTTACQELLYSLVPASIILCMVFGEPKTHKAVVPLTIFGLFATFQDPNYSFQSCVLSWVAKEAGCHLDWFRSDRLRWKPSCRKQYFSKSPINGVAPCSRVEDITSYQNALSKALLVSCSHLLQHSPPASFSLKGALAEAQWDDRLYAPLCCQVSFLASQVLQWP